MEKVQELKVVFRKCADGGEIIAFLPETSACYRNIMSYMHVGQHAEASYEYYLTTQKAEKREYEALLQELKQIYEPDYKLVIRRRLYYPDLLEAWKHCAA